MENSDEQAGASPEIQPFWSNSASVLMQCAISCWARKLARLRARGLPRIEEAEEIEEDAQQMAQSEVDEAVDVVEEQRLRAVERALAKIEGRDLRTIRCERRSDTEGPAGSHSRSRPLQSRNRRCERSSDGDSTASAHHCVYGYCRRDCQLTTSALGTFET